jgi:hypothetical protein
LTISDKALEANINRAVIREGSGTMTTIYLDDPCDTIEFLFPKSGKDENTLDKRPNAKSDSEGCSENETTGMEINLLDPAPRSPQLPKQISVPHNGHISTDALQNDMSCKDGEQGDAPTSKGKGRLMIPYSPTSDDSPIDAPYMDLDNSPFGHNSAFEKDLEKARCSK